MLTLSVVSYSHMISVKLNDLVFCFTIGEKFRMSQDRETSVVAHYGVSRLGEKILDAAQQSGLNSDALTAVGLAPVGEFHMGGRAATEHIVRQMKLPSGAHVLDVGSGLGGLVHYLASESGCHAIGIDLTPEYVQVAQMLTERTGLTEYTDFHIGSALDLPWSAASFEAAVTFHVAMNIADRPRLYEEVARVTHLGGVFANYDVMKGPSAGLEFPVPWAETADTNFLVTPSEMGTLLSKAGFEVIHEEDRSEIAIAHHHSRIKKTFLQSEVRHRSVCTCYKKTLCKLNLAIC